MDRRLSALGAREIDMANRQIDPNKLRAALRRLGDDSVFYLLNEAIDLLPQAKLVKLVKRYIDPSELVRRVLRALQRQLEKPHGKIYRHQGVDRRLSPASRLLHDPGKEGRSCRCASGLRNHVRVIGPYRPVS